MRRPHARVQGVFNFIGLDYINSDSIVSGGENPAPILILTMWSSRQRHNRTETALGAATSRPFSFRDQTSFSSARAFLHPQCADPHWNQL